MRRVSGLGIAVLCSIGCVDFAGCASRFDDIPCVYDWNCPLEMPHCIAGLCTAPDAGTGASPSGGGTGDGGAPGGCVGSPKYCDDFTEPSKAGEYVEAGGAWTRDAGAGTYTVRCTKPGNYPRLRATLRNISMKDFDATIVGTGIGKAGFGLIFGKSAVGQTDAGSEFAVILHPQEFTGLYLKRIFPVDSARKDEPMGEVHYDGGLRAGPWKLRVKRAGKSITAWLGDATVATLVVDAGTSESGPFALVGSMSSEDSCPDDGAQFSLLRVDDW